MSRVNPSLSFSATLGTVKSRISPPLLILMGVLGAYCTDTAMDAVRGDGSTPDAQAQTMRTETIIDRGSLAEGAVGGDATSAYGISGYEGLVIQYWSRPGTGCRDPEITVEGRLAADAPFSSVARFGSQGLYAIPAVGRDVRLSLSDFTADDCEVEWILAGVN